MKTNDKGFSLVELIIVIAIMAILAAAIAPALIRYIDKSRRAVDVETAQTLYDAASVAITSDDDVNDSFNANVGTNFPEITDDDGKVYKPLVVSWCRGNRKATQNRVFTPANGATTTFNDEFKKNIGQDGIDMHGNADRGASCKVIKYKKDSGKGDPECWIICRRSDNSELEVWIGYKPHGNVVPAYRMYPNTCKEYK